MKGNQGASLPQSWRKVTKGLFYLGTGAVATKGLLYLDLDERSIKGLLYLDLDERSIKGLLLLQSELLKCRSKGFSTSIWVVEMSIKGLLYFDLSCWEVDQRASLHCSGTTEMSIKGLLYFDLNCWNVDQRASLLWSKLLPAKSQNLGIDFKWWVLCGPTIFVMCDFQLFLLDLNFFIF